MWRIGTAITASMPNALVCAIKATMAQPPTTIDEAALFRQLAAGSNDRPDLTLALP